jgi:hypothetical protein
LDVEASGIPTLADLVKQHGTLPKTPTSRSGGGGIHYFMSAPSTVRNSPVTEGIEIRGNGGYVVIPESRHKSGRVYEWLISPADVEIAPIPAWLLQLIETAKHQRKRVTTARIRLTPTTNGEEAASDLKIRHPSRYRFLHSQAGRLRRAGLTAEEMLPNLRRLNAERCVPPKEDGVIVFIAHDTERRYPEGPPPDDDDSCVVVVEA